MKLTKEDLLKLDGLSQLEHIINQSLLTFTPNILNIQYHKGSYYALLNVIETIKGLRVLNIKSEIKDNE